MKIRVPLIHFRRIHSTAAPGALFFDASSYPGADLIISAGLEFREIRGGGDFCGFFKLLFLDLIIVMHEFLNFLIGESFFHVKSHHNFTGTYFVS